MNDVGVMESLLNSKEQLLNTLTDSPFTWNSVYGVLVILFLVGLVFMAVKKVGHAVLWGFSVMLFVQIMHIIAFSPEVTAVVPEVIPILQTIFKYEPITALAQLCVGTKLSEWLVMLQVFLNRTIGEAVEVVLIYGTMVVQHIIKTLSFLYN